MTTLGDLPLVPRWTLRGAAVLGTLGAVAGLVLGLVAHPPTAWFAVLEVGVPAAALGGVLGAVVGVLARTLVRRPQA